MHISGKKTKCKLKAVDIAGIVEGNISESANLYNQEKFITPQGHGFAAEQANHLYDKIRTNDFFGKNKIRLVGDDKDPMTGRIIKNGADRIVGGVPIQTKYCSTGFDCIQACFENGNFRYFNSDGSPMQIEVPADKYEQAIQALQDRIINGQVKGITDPNDANKIVRKGDFTYEQAKNIAKSGTVESIKFDAVNGVVVASTALGISALLSFATSLWNGEDLDVALKNASFTGLKVGGTTFVTTVFASQFTKAGLNSALVGSSESIVNIMGPKASAVLVNAFRSGTNIYGAAAMKSAAKLLRGNVITGAVSVVVLSSFDIVDIFKNKISPQQLFKNVTGTTATVAGGTAGWIGGATAGAAVGSVVPVLGTAVGGFIGGVLGSFAAGAVSNKVTNVVLDEFIQNDADEMLNIIEEVFQQIAVDYLLNQEEAEKIIDKLKDRLSSNTLKDMYASSDRKLFAHNLLIDIVEEVVKERKYIDLPDNEQIGLCLIQLLEDISDSEEMVYSQ